MIKRIAVIGSGIAGLILGIILKRKGFEVTLFEKNQTFKPLGGDMPLWPSSMRVLEKVGLYEKIFKHSGHYSSIKFGTERGHSIREILVNTTPNYHTHLNISRYELLKILVEALGEESLVFNKKCVNITETFGEVTAYFEDGSSVVADLLIGADGANSLIRDYVCPNSQQEYTGYISLGGISSMPIEINYNLLFGKFLSGAFPISQNRNMIFFVSPLEESQCLSASGSFLEKSKLFRNHTTFLDEMINNLEMSLKINNNYFYVKSYYLPPLKNWSKGRVLLMGEAAHLIGSLVGCSTTMIFEGADLLGEILLETQKNYRDGLEHYQSRHQSRVNQLLKFEREFSSIFINHDHQERSISSYLRFYDELFHFVK